MADLSHLNAFEYRLSNERLYLDQAKTDQERALRKVWISQIEKEIAAEKVFLGISGNADDSDISDDDLLRELGEC